MTALQKLFIVTGSDGLVTNRSMTIEEILEILHCTVCTDEDSLIAELGEVIDMDTGKATGIYYDDITSGCGEKEEIND